MTKRFGRVREPRNDDSVDRKNCFEVVSGTKSFVFKTNDAGSCSKWIELIRKGTNGELTANDAPGAARDASAGRDVPKKRPGSPRGFKKGLGTLRLSREGVFVASVRTARECVTTLENRRAVYLVD